MGSEFQAAELFIIKDIVHNLMLPMLRWTYSLVGNYGVAIILLTIFVKLLMFPILKKQFESMKKIQEVQPELKRLRSQYKDDPKGAQAAMVAFYTENNMNPLQGCLPMLVQIPVFLSIYAAIVSDAFRTMVQGTLDAGGSIGLTSFWLTDLTAYDRYYVLPVVLAVVTYFSQKVVISDESQKKLIWLAPIVLLIFSVKLPSGVLLYWLTSSIVTFVQQIYVLKPELFASKKKGGEVAISEVKVSTQIKDED